MLNEFGIFTRKLRIETGQRLKDMADELGISSSYLSATEIGKRPIPVKWLDILKTKYNLSHEQYLELERAYENSLDSINIDLNQRDDSDKDLILSFARNFDSLDDKNKEYLRKIFKRSWFPWITKVNLDPEMIYEKLLIS